MDTAILRSRILDLAIRGQLVPQDPNEGTADDLLKTIATQRGKAITPITDNVPFDIPANWRWVKLGDISNYGECISKDVHDLSKDAWILELEDLEKGSARIIQRITLQDRQIKGIRREFHKGAILYSKLRTYLNKVLIAPSDGYCTTEIVPFDTLCYNPFICQILRSPYYLGYTAQLGYGVKMPRMSTTDVKRSLIPLPPLAEQHRIVAKVEELLSEVDKIEQAQADITQAATILRSRVLDSALKGDLTHSNTEEWTWDSITNVTDPISSRDSQIKASKIQSTGKYAVVSQGQKLIDGYCDDEDKVITISPVILFGDHTRNVKYIDFPFVVGADGTKLHKCKSIDPKFCYYWILWAADNMTNRGYERHYSLLKQTPLHLPPLAEQRRIVAKLEELLSQIDKLN